jgi:hypothetical protein
MIEAAFLSPMPTMAVARVSASALLISTGPANAWALNNISNDNSDEHR